MDALSISAMGMTTALQRFDTAAVKAVQPSSDPVSDAMDEQQSKDAFQASAAVFKTVDKMYGSLLDITV
jgi:hypothetical protein